MKTKSDSFAFCYKNTLPKPKEGASWSSFTKKIYHLYIFSNVLYRSKRNILSRALEAKTSKRKNKEITLRKTQEKKEFLLKYIQERETAQRFLKLHENHLQKGNLSFVFSSLEDLQVGKIYQYESSANIFFFLVTQKVKVKNQKTFEYEGVSTFRSERFKTQEKHLEGAYEKENPLLEISISNSYDSLPSSLSTDYREDENNLRSYDMSASHLGGSLFLREGLYFIASYSFESFVVSEIGAVLRKRPLSKVSFRVEGSSLKIQNIKGLFLKGNLGSERIFGLGKKASQFCWR